MPTAHYQKACHRRIVYFTRRANQRRLEAARFRCQTHNCLTPIGRVRYAPHQSIALHPLQRVRHRRLLDIGEPVQFGVGQPVLLPKTQDHRKLPRHSAMRRDLLMERARAASRGGLRGTRMIAGSDAPCSCQPLPRSGRRRCRRNSPRGTHSQAVARVQREKRCVHRASGLVQTP